MKLDSASSLPDLSNQSTALTLKAQTDTLTSVATVETQAVVADSSRTTLQSPIKKQSSGAVFGSTFLTIFLAEFGDKTQLSTLLMSAESQSPWVVFLGSAAALVTTSLLGVLLGCWLATRLTPKKMETAAGVSLLLISAMLLWEVVH